MIADPLSVGDLIIVNQKFRSYLYNPKRYEGVGIIISKKKVHRGEIYDAYFSGWIVRRIPRHWLVKMGLPDSVLYCPIEEEWKLWGDI